jgi:hypothetical protein
VREDCEDCVPDGSSSSELVVRTLDSSLCRMRVRVSGGSFCVEFVIVVRTFAADLRRKELARDGGLLFVRGVVEVEVLLLDAICGCLLGEG